MKDVKIVIGANYGDEGKGLLTRYFVQEARNDGKLVCGVLSNGTAQRGHTVDYNENFRHVYHHFSSGTADDAITFFPATFYVHPMEFRREYVDELFPNGIKPICICDPNAQVITPFDMIADRATEEWIEHQTSTREFGSCCFGSWCAIEDRPRLYTMANFVDARKDNHVYETMLKHTWKECLKVLEKRGVDIAQTSFKNIVNDQSAVINNFIQDINFFIDHNIFSTFDKCWKDFGFNTFVFENGQGLGLDVNVNNPWHTTTPTGLTNPVNLLKNQKNYNAEVCYVTRSYLTRHGDGPLEEMVKKNEINADMLDLTNVPNPFQGTLRYGFLEDRNQTTRIDKDWLLVKDNPLFKKSIAVTHCNEFINENDNSEYYSNDPYSVIKRR